MRNIAASLLLHVLVWAGWMGLLSHLERIAPPEGLHRQAPRIMEVTPLARTKAPPAHPGRPGPSGTRGARHAAPGLDLRPSFAKNGLGVKAMPGGTPGPGKGEEGYYGTGEAYRRQLLFTEGRVELAFDGLASRIDRRLDFPLILAENGLEGTTSLELRFDGEGRVDEARSQIMGSNRPVRGLLIRAVRQGVKEWFRNEARLIRKESFRNQTFRADFVATSLTTSLSQLSKPLPGSYIYLRRKYVAKTNPCLGVPLGGIPTLDLACVALKVNGAIQRQFSSRYLSSLQSLVDTLERYDERMLQGLNAELEA